MQRGVSTVLKRSASSKLPKKNQIINQNISNALYNQHHALKLLGMTNSTYGSHLPLFQKQSSLFSFSRFFNNLKSFLPSFPQKHTQINITKLKNQPLTLSELNLLRKELDFNNNIKITKTTQKSTKKTTDPTQLAKSTKTQQIFQTFMNASRRNVLHGITVAAGADQYDQLRQISRDFSLTSPDLQHFHDMILQRKLPFNSTTDIEFTLKPEVNWTADSFLGFLKNVVTAPWDALRWVWKTCVKVYLRFTKKYDSGLTPWVYQILDLRVPLEDLVFDIKNFAPEEHQLYTLITYILRYQLVIELALKNAITQAQFPEEFIRQLEEKADQNGLSDDEFQKQLDLSSQQFQKSKIRALKSLKLMGVPQDFYPDDQVVELIQNFDFPPDFPVEQIIQEPRLGLELIRRLIAEQLSQVPMPQMSALLELKGLSQALRSIQQPEHFTEYKRLFQFISSPDMNLRRQVRQLSIQGSNKDYEKVRQTVIKQLQHIRRVIKTYQRQQTQLREFGFVVKRKPNLSRRQVNKMSKVDQALYMQDLQEGLFLTIDDVDPEEEAEGSLIADEPGMAVPERYRRNRRGGSSNKTMNERRDARNRRIVENKKPLGEEDMIITLRLLALNAEAQETNDMNFDFQDRMEDSSRDAELFESALERFDGDVRALEKELRPIFYDIKREIMNQDDDKFINDDYDDDYYDTEDYDDGADDDYNGYDGDDNGDGLDPLYDDDYDDERYLDEHLIPTRNRDDESEEQREERDRMEADNDNRRNSTRDEFKKQVNSSKKTNNNNSTKKRNRYRELPAHVMRDPNPKLVSKDWYNDALKHHSTFQDRLRQVEHVIMERDFHLKDKYLAATRYFSSVLLDESKEREKSLKMQDELAKYVRGLFDLLPNEIKDDFFTQRAEFYAQNAEPKKGSQNDPKSSTTQQPQLKLSGENTTLDSLSQQPADEMPDLSSLATPTPSANSSTTTEAPFTTTTTENVVNTPTGSVILGDKVIVKSPSTPLESQADTNATLNSILNADGGGGGGGSTPKTETGNDKTDAKSGVVQKSFPKAANRKEELEQLNEMLEVVQTYQLDTYRNKYMMQELQRVHKRKEMDILRKNDDILRELQDKEQDQDGVPLSEDELSANEDLQRVRAELESINVRPTRAMEQRSMQRAMQHTELPLVQQLSLNRIKTLSNVELYNSEMLDIMYSSLRDFLQTALYDAGDHNIVENSVSGLILTVLNSPKSVESYDNMARFNEQVEDQVNKPRLVVDKLSSMQRKWLLMQLQQEHALNKYYPLGQLPPVIPFLNPQNEQEQLFRHELEFSSNKDGKYPYCALSLQDVIKPSIDHSEIVLKAKQSQTVGVSIPITKTIPLFTNEIQLQERIGNYIVSEQPDTFVVSPAEIQLDLYDSRYDIISQKHLFNQLKRVRDRRLRELLQLIGMVGTDPQVLASTTKFHIKTLEPALHMTGVPENLVVYLTKYYNHKTIAATLEEMIKVLSSMRKQVSDKAIDYSLSEYDVTLQYCMDLYQYHIKQLQLKMPDFYSAQFKAMDLSFNGIKAVNEPWKPEYKHPLSLKELNSVAFADSEMYSV
jgi:hypothetical protein